MPRRINIKSIAQTKTTNTTSVKIAASIMLATSTVAMFLVLGMLSVIAGNEIAKEQKVSMALGIEKDGVVWRSEMFPSGWEPIDKVGPRFGTNIFYSGDCESCWSTIGDIDDLDDIRVVNFRETVDVLDTDDFGNATRKRVVDERTGDEIVVENRHPYRFLHDFSYAGYRNGNEDIPPLVVPDCRSRSEDPEVVVCSSNRIDSETGLPQERQKNDLEDCTAEIQAAINAVSDEGGVVYLSEGEYKVSDQDGDKKILEIEDSGVVLCGAGPEKTFLRVDPYEGSSYDMEGKAVIYIGDNDGWRSERETGVTQDIVLPTKEIPVASTSGFKKGDKIMVLANITDSFRDEHDMSGTSDEDEYWPLGKTAYSFRAIIEEVDEESRILFLDTPTRYRIKTSDNPRVHKLSGGVEEIGIENLSIGIIRHPDHYENENSSNSDLIDDNYLIRLNRVWNSWVYNVRSYPPFENLDNPETFRSLDEYIVNFLNDAMKLRYTKGITVQNFAFSGCQRNAYSAACYGIDIDDTNEALFQDGILRNVKKGFTINANGPSSGNVFRNIKILDPIGKRSPIDYHGRLAMANLIENIEVESQMFQATVRPDSSEDGHGTTQSVFWNIVGLREIREEEYPWAVMDWDPETSGDDICVIASNQFGWGYVVGTYGEFTDVCVSAMPDEDYDDDRNPWRPLVLPRDFCEGTGCRHPFSPGRDYSGLLEPRSLYLAQKAIRQAENVAGRDFSRGDVDANGRTNITDAIIILKHLFQGEAPIICSDAADTDDNGFINISDAVYLLNHLFKGGDDPPPPFRECGTDPTSDNLGCEAFLPCN